MNDFLYFLHKFGKEKRCFLEKKFHSWKNFTKPPVATVTHRILGQEDIIQVLAGAPYTVKHGTQAKNFGKELVFGTSDSRLAPLASPPASQSKPSLSSLTSIRRSLRSSFLISLLSSFLIRRKSLSRLFLLRTAGLGAGSISSL